MKRELNIKSYCHIKGQSIWKDGKPFYTKKENGFSDFAKSAYRFMEISHPKFFKMDNLSKLAFLASETLLRDESLKADENDIALVFSNRASSLNTDRKHQKSIEDPKAHFPSPAIFVYTLPNICLGEISIRHKLYSENSFFIFARFNAEHLQMYADELLQKEKTKKVLSGWVDFDDNDWEAFLYLVEDEGTIPHNAREIKRLYTLL